MKTALPPLLIALAVQTAALPAAEQIVTLGDSLTFAYEAEFCFQQTISGIGTIGDGFPASVRNWIEVLSTTPGRADRFELGIRDSVTVDPPFDPPFQLYFRQSHNWAIPGLKVDGLRQYLEGQAQFTDLLGGSPEFSTLHTILSYSDFNNATDFPLSQLQSQIQGTADRLTIFIGGNDVKAIYGSVYGGAPAGTFVADFMADMVVVLDKIQELKADIPIVLVNVPHIGITPDIRSSWPYNPVNTERVSVVIRELNRQLADLARTRGIGYADVYTPTVRLLDGVTRLCIHGMDLNPGSTSGITGNLNRTWLNGSISKNFHPNTGPQLVIANEIVRAFNRTYQTGIAPLTATEMLVNRLGKLPANVDMTFATWMVANFPAQTLPFSDDSDGDGIAAGVEFATGLSPVRNDADLVTQSVVGGELQLAYPTRLPGSPRYTLVPESSANLVAPFTPFPVIPAADADGLTRARLPVGQNPNFLRLKATVTP